MRVQKNTMVQQNVYLLMKVQFEVLHPILVNKLQLHQHYHHPQPVETDLCQSISFFLFFFFDIFLQNVTNSNNVVRAFITRSTIDFQCISISLTIFFNSLLGFKATKLKSEGVVMMMLNNRLRHTIFRFK
jgi:hypothetical protein